MKHKRVRMKLGNERRPINEDGVRESEKETVTMEKNERVKRKGTK